jgi:acetyl-CoA carboxylase biotin carboxyl carrier protein
MDIREIQDLIKFVAKSGVSEVSLETENFKLTVKTEAAKSKSETVVYAQMPQVEAAASVAQVPASTSAAAEKPKAAEESSNLITIKSPMIGTFYRTPSPDKPAFVSVGTEIKKGQVLCIVEAMKLFNEIESDISGTVVKILVDDKSPIEYDQPLFLVEPN